ncbi:HAD-IIB family hydrolase [Actinomycetaceae bacterium MB13-C1-2]|nr:HAD-IIB family hydrolase [Actinomycetaceae bacterium MB13-C1-2]
MNKDADPQTLLKKSDWKLVAFDLDDTLAPSKSPLPEPMATALRRLLDVGEVAVISGGALPQFRLQLLDNLGASADELSRLHLLPTCGTQYLRFDQGKLEEVYAHHLSKQQRDEAIQVLADAANELGLWEAAPWGDIIEDRGSQITFSALGQKAPLDAKRAWDPTGEKKSSLVAKVAPLLPELEVRGGGSTSVDITAKGIDKAYGMNALLGITGYDKNQMLFIGDRLDPGGNDYPVRAAGWPTFAVDSWQETVVAVTQIATAIDRDQSR